VEAVRLKNELERELSVPIRVRTGGPGALDVYVDGKQIYSKKGTGRLPTADELIKLIRARAPRA
jgi:selT/selW/selH-like putative selenoprotein